MMIRMDDEWRNVISEGSFLFNNDFSNDVDGFSDDIQTYLNIQIYDQLYWACLVLFCDCAVMSGKL